MTARLRADLFVQFARAHLPSGAERAVYRILAGTPDREWLAGEVAAAAGGDHHETDQALRRFASAGIVADTPSRGHGHRYRWHPAMAYLRDGDVDDTATDPVCGMPVPHGVPHTANDGDREVRFCSLPCLVRWTSDRRRGQVRR